MGRGLLEDAPDVAIGTYLGAAGDTGITRLVEEADALLLLGVILSDTNFALSERVLDARRTMLALDREVRIGHHVYPDMPLDALIGALIERAPNRAGAQGRGARAGRSIRATCPPMTARSRPPTSPAPSTICSTGTGRCR